MLKRILDVDQKIVGQPTELSTNLDQDFEIDTTEPFVEIQDGLQEHRLSEVKTKMMRHFQAAEPNRSSKANLTMDDLAMR